MEWVREWERLVFRCNGLTYDPFSFSVSGKLKEVKSSHGTRHFCGQTILLFREIFALSWANLTFHGLLSGRSFPHLAFRPESSQGGLILFSFHPRFHSPSASPIPLNFFFCFFLFTALWNRLCIRQIATDGMAKILTLARIAKYPRGEYNVQALLVYYENTKKGKKKMKKKEKNVKNEKASRFLNYHSSVS